jgi:argininosuccinate lyase
VQYGIAQNKRIEEFSLAELKRFSETFGADLYEYIAPAAMIRRRRALGGTARCNVVRRLKELGI